MSVAAPAPSKPENDAAAMVTAPEALTIEVLAGVDLDKPGMARLFQAFAWDQAASISPKTYEAAGARIAKDRNAFGDRGWFTRQPGRRKISTLAAG